MLAFHDFMEKKIHESHGFDENDGYVEADEDNQPGLKLSHLLLLQGDPLKEQNHLGGTQSESDQNQL